MNYPPTPAKKSCNCETACISTDAVYYSGPNLPNSGVNTDDLLTLVIEKLDAVYAVPTLQRVAEAGNISTLPLNAHSFVKLGGDGTNLLLDDGTVLPIGDLPASVTETSQLINDGEDGLNPFITLQDIPIFNPSDYDLDEFTNNDVDPFAHISDIPASPALVFLNEGNGNGIVRTDRNPAHFGNIGKDAFDISTWDSDAPDTGDYGARGESSFVSGTNNKATGYGTFINGGFCTANGIFSLITGYYQSETGVTYSNFLTGIGHSITGGSYATIVGQFANVISNNPINVNDGTNTMFAVGNGTATNPGGTLQSRSTAFQVYRDGRVIAPSLTIPLIEADTSGKILINKEYVNNTLRTYKTYFINTATGNNATGVYEDASKPFADIDYVNANFTIQDNNIFYLQGTGLTYLINNQLQAKKQTFRADSGSTNILDFSSNTNTNAMLTGGSNNIVTIDMPSGVLRCERSGGTGVILKGGSEQFALSLNLNVKEIYWNTSTALAQTGGLICKVQADKISAKALLFQSINNDIIVQEFVCLAAGALLTSSSLAFGNIRINLISGFGSYNLCSSNGIHSKITIGNVTATGGLVWSGYFGEMDVTFDNSTITGFNLFANSSLKTLRGTIKSITSISGVINDTKFINFVANLGTGNMTIGNVGGLSPNTVTFENCSIKSTNSPIILTALANLVEIKNSTFEVVNAVPLMTGGAGGTNTVKIAGLSTNANVLSDQSGTGVTVNVIGKNSVADGVDSKDTVNKGQLDSGYVAKGVDNATTVVLSLSTLNSTYPTATAGFKVYCASITTGAMTYEKTPTGWLGFTCIVP